MQKSRDIMIRLPIDMANEIEEKANKEGLTLATKIRSIVFLYYNDDK